MTTIYFEKIKDKYVVECTDHATGSEKACAGISAITSALFGWIKNSHEEVKAEACELVPGYAYFKFTGGSDTASVFKLVYIGLKQIAMGYPESVFVIDNKIDML